MIKLLIDKYEKHRTHKKAEKLAEFVRVYSAGFTGNNLLELPAGLICDEKVLEAFCTKP